MSDDAVNDWELGSGLDLDGAKVEITKCVFEFANELGPNVLAAKMEFTPIDGGESGEQLFSVGKGFEADRTGENLVSNNGKPRKLNMSSNFGVLLSSAMDCLAGDQEKGETDKEYMERRARVAAEVLGSPRHAPNWLGTMWELGTITRETMNPQTKAKRDSIGFVFTEWLGDSIDADASTTTEEEPEPEKPAKAAARSTTKVGGKPAGRVGGRGGKAKSDVPEGVSEELWNTLVELAVEVMGRDATNEHEDFMDEAMEVEGVDGNKAAEKVIVSTRTGSVWAVAKAK